MKNPIQKPIPVSELSGSVLDKAVFEVAKANGLEEKWKAFAVNHFLSSYSDKVDSSILFDWIMDTEDTGLPTLFSEYEVIVWMPFEKFELSEIAEKIQDLAFEAQQVANE